eukprot:scaffold7344_cov127-Isochrysis_galbana.AAC.4
MVGRLVTIELALHRADVDDEALLHGRIDEQRPQARVEDEGGEGVDRERLGRLVRGDFVQPETPRVARAQVELLPIDVVKADWEGFGIVGPARPQRELRPQR